MICHDNYNRVGRDGLDTPIIVLCHTLQKLMTDNRLCRKRFILPNLHNKNPRLCEMEWIYIQGKMKGSILFELVLEAMKNKSRKLGVGEKFIVGPLSRDYGIILFIVRTCFLHDLYIHN